MDDRGLDIKVSFSSLLENGIKLLLSIKSPSLGDGIENAATLDVCIAFPLRAELM